MIYSGYIFVDVVELMKTKVKIKKKQSDNVANRIGNANATRETGVFDLFSLRRNQICIT